MAAKSRSARFYAANPSARAKKNEYQKTFNKKPDQVKKRVALNAYNKKHKDPVGNHTDASHGKGGKIVGYSHESRNRGDVNNSIGDKKARNPKYRRGGKKR